MRILHILDHSIPLHSGYTFRTRALLREQAARGWETFQLTSPKQGPTMRPYEEVDGLRFYRSHQPTGRLAGLPVTGEILLMREIASRLSEVIEEVKPDILHAHSPVLNVLPALNVAKRMKLPVVYEIRAFWEDAAVDHGTAKAWGARYRLTRALETYALQRVDHAFTICEGLRKDIVARGIPDSKVTVIPNAVDATAFAPSGPADESLKTSLGLQGHTVLGFIGSFYAYEGLDLLLDALPKILAFAPDVKVLLVGGGYQEAALRSQVQRLGLSGKVVFTGRVPHAEVQRYYDLVDILAYPRHPMRLTDLVTPLKPLEAMAQQRIFVASDVGGHQELIRDGETGVLFKAGDCQSLTDAVLGLLNHRDRWPAMKAAGRHFVEAERTWQRSAANYAPVFERLLGQRKG